MKKRAISEVKKRREEKRREEEEEEEKGKGREWRRGHYSSWSVPLALKSIRLFLRPTPFPLSILNRRKTESRMPLLFPLALPLLTGDKGAVPFVVVSVTVLLVLSLVAGLE
jgi:hypothetical protein